MFCCFRSKDEDEASPRRLKMVIVGDGDCGKTCLLHRFAHHEFLARYDPTVFEVEVKTVIYKNQEVNLLMYDTAGQEDYDRLRPFSYSDTDVMIVAFSLDSPDSLDNVLLNWLPEVRYFCGNIPILLVGNKLDLRHAQHSLVLDAGRDVSPEELKKRLAKTTVSYDKGRAVAEKMGAVGYFETSAKTGDGVDAAFEGVIRAGMEMKVKRKRGPFGWRKT